MTATVVTAILAFAMSLLMVYSGMLFDPAGFRQILGGQGLRELVRPLLANYLVIPALTVLLVAVLPMSPPLRVGLLVLSLMPCAPMVPALAERFGEPTHWPLFLFMFFSTLNLLLSPLLIVLLPQPWAAGGIVHLSDDIALPLTRYVLLTYAPLALGVMLRLRLSPRRFAVALPAMRIGFAGSMLIAVILFFIVHWHELLAVTAIDVGSLVLFEGGCAAVAWMLIAPLAGRTLLADVLTASFRNFAMAIAFSAIVLSNVATSVLLASMALTFAFWAVLVALFHARRRKADEGGGSGVNFAKILCVLVMVATSVHFALAILHSGIDHGAGMDVFQAGYAADPWQAVIDVDLMAGLALVCAWLLWREDDRQVGAAWVIAILWWGNLLVAAYLLRQLHLAGGRWDRFFLGPRRAGLPAPRIAFARRTQVLMFATAIAIAVYAFRGAHAVGFEQTPTVGYAWGFGSLSLGLLAAALRGREGRAEPSD